MIKSGIDILKGNPWDRFGADDHGPGLRRDGVRRKPARLSQTGPDFNPKDAAVNRHCGRALGRMGHFDQAIICWRRVELLKPGDEEANRAIGDLTVEKTIHLGGLRRLPKPPKTSSTSVATPTMISHS